MDSIRINDLKIPARHGVYDFEKSKDEINSLNEVKTIASQLSCI